MPFYIHVQETPNPNAVKFISQYTVKAEGKSNYKSKEDAPNNPLAQKLFDVEGVKQVFFFDNYITITKDGELDWSPLSETIHDLLQDELPKHDPKYADDDNEATPQRDRSQLPPEVVEIEEILDRTVRPYLASDGGGIEVVERKENVVYIKYQGACGTCPSAIGGTLMAIESTLRAELGDDIEVVDTGGGAGMYGGGGDDYWW